MAKEKLSENDYLEAANWLGVDVAAIKAVREIEGGKEGFLPSGRMKILFEGHVFWNRLKRRGKSPEAILKAGGLGDILYPKWTKAFYKGGEREWDRLSRAISIDSYAALESASYGLFQIMGFHYETLGFSDVEAMYRFMDESEKNQLIAFCRWIKKNGLDVYLQKKMWAKFARGYNGAGYAANAYDVKLERAYNKYSRGK